MLNLSKVHLKKRKDRDDQYDHLPQFLSKCFNMISTCAPNIAGWSESGDSFFIYDVDRLCSEIIPTVFKHNKFSSFVRQLHFYGFKKVIPEHVYPNGWEQFRHPFFRKNEPALLVKIKKSGHFEESSPVGDELAYIREHMQNINDRVQFLRSVVEDLTTNVNILLLSTQLSVDTNPPNRRIGPFRSFTDDFALDGSKLFNYDGDETPNNANLNEEQLSEQELHMSLEQQVLQMNPNLQRRLRPQLRQQILHQLQRL